MPGLDESATEICLDGGVMLLVLYVGVYLLVWMQHVIMGVWNSVQKV